MDSNKLVRELIKLLSDLPGVNVAPTSISKRSRVFQLSGQLNGLIYVKVIAHSPHRWGITKNTADKIKFQGKPWCVILVYDSPNTGYVISSSKYDKRSGGLWPDAQGDFKISDGKSLVGIPKFGSVDELVSILSGTLTRTPRVDS